jgi:large subunit ribosomal protein L15
MLHTLSPAKGSRRSIKRIGRGSGSGHGTTAGRGTKGQQSRTGKGRRFGFEGGQTPLVARQPKLGGFRNAKHITYEVINLDTLETKLAAGSYDQTALREARVVRTKRPIKILSRGALSKKFDLTVDAVSTGAKAAIEKAGGSVKTAA